MFRAWVNSYRFHRLNKSTFCLSLRFSPKEIILSNINDILTAKNRLTAFLNGDCGFVAYRLPGEQAVHVFSIREVSAFTLEDFSTDDYNGAFVVAPYDVSRAFALWPSDDKALVPLQHHFSTASGNAKKIILPTEDDRGRNAYSTAFATLKNALDLRVIDKIVLARKMEVSDVPSDVLPDVFEQLCHSYAGAFVYFISHPLTGKWMGASPESFLEKEGNYLQTVALAATRGSNMHTEDWDLKELEEQGLVSVFIDEVLKQSGVSGFMKKGPVPLKAGELIHLRTSYRFAEEDLKIRTGGFLKALHPTPAVGGYPKEKALALIKQAELLDRGLYSGFLGPVSENAFRFFVNIRCMKLENNKAFLYLGGGVTRDSREQHEWEETRLKAGTLLSVLNSVKQNHYNESTHLR